MSNSWQTSVEPKRKQGKSSRSSSWTIGPFLRQILTWAWTVFVISIVSGKVSKLTVISCIFCGCCSGGVSVLERPEEVRGGVRLGAGGSAVPHRVLPHQRRRLHIPHDPRGCHQLPSLQAYSAGRTEDQWRSPLQVSTLNKRTYVLLEKYTFASYTQAGSPDWDPTTFSRALSGPKNIIFKL